MRRRRLLLVGVATGDRSLDQITKAIVWTLHVRSFVYMDFSATFLLPLRAHAIMHISKKFTLYIYTHIPSRNASLHLSEPKVRLQLTHIPLAKLLLRIRRADARRDNDILALLPVNRRHDALLVARLQAVDDAQHLGGVPAGRRRVHHGQPDLLGRVDDEDGADGEGDAALFRQPLDVLLRDHVVEPGDGAVCVGDDGELDGRVVDFVDVRDPFGVRREVVGGLRGLELLVKCLSRAGSF